MIDIHMEAHVWTPSQNTNIFCTADLSHGMLVLRQYIGKTLFAETVKYVEEPEPELLAPIEWRAA